MTLTQRILRAFKTAPKSIGVAVSGGSDSLALLVAMTDAFPNAHIKCATVDHGLRPEARGEAIYVAEICAGLGVSHDILSLSDLEPGANLQARARDERYRALGKWGLGLDVICLGHTKTDVAETFLIRLARGSGADGLAEMSRQWQRYGMDWARPLLDATREELQDFLTQKGVTWCSDPSNQDEAFTRVKMRNAQPIFDNIGLTTDRLASTAVRMGKVQAALEYAIAQAVPSVLSRDFCDVLVHSHEFAKLPQELAERIFAMCLGWVGQQTYRPRNDALQRAMSAKTPSTLHGCVIIPQQNGQVRIIRELAAAPGLEPDGGSEWDGRFTCPDLRPNQRICALGEAGLQQIPNWRDTKRPRIAVLSSPAIWHGDRVIAAPMAGFGPVGAIQINLPPWEIALTR